MQNYLDAREIRIFISSTFVDMQQERDTLVSTVFPYLRKIAAERRVTVTDVDLRWGIKEESDHLKIVETCLEEIEKSHPFFIGLLGSRYGWIPSNNKKIDWSQVLPAQYDEALAEINAGLSMTEIEIKYGVFNNKDNQVYGHFYLRDCPDELVEPNQKRLRDAICAQDDYPFFIYSTVEDLAAKIIEDFTQLLDSLFPLENTNTGEYVLGMESAAMKERIRYYVPRVDVEKSILAFIMSSQGGTCVLTGDVGIGKTTTLSKVALDLIENNEIDIIPVFASSTFTKSTIEGVASFICNSLTNLYSLDDGFPNDPVSRLRSYACQIHPGKPLCIIVDGIEQLSSADGTDTSLTWWPSWDANVRIIFSSPADDEIMKELRWLKAQEVNMGRLKIDQRFQLAELFFKPYRKELTPDMQTLISSDNQLLDSTLIYTIVLDEIRRYGDYDSLYSFATKLINCQTDSDLFDIILQREESVFADEGVPVLNEILPLIVLSESGLTESELIELSGTSRLYVSRVLSLNDFHLIKQDGRVFTSHDMIGQAIKRRYLNDKATEIKLRKRIIDYYRHSELSQKQILEVAFQFYTINDLDSLYKWICRNEVLSVFFDSGQSYILARYWSRLLKENPYRYDILGYAYDIMCSETSGSFFWDEGFRDVFLSLFSSALVKVADMSNTYLSKTIAAQRVIDGLCKLLENELGEGYDKIKESARKRKHIASRMAGKWKSALSGQLDVIKTDAKDIAAAEVLNAGEFLLSVYEVTKQEGYLNDAIDILKTVLDARIKQYGENHYEVAVALANYGSAVAEKDLQKGLDYHKRSLAIYMSLFGYYNVDVAIQNHNIAMLLLKFNPEEAIEYSKAALDINKHLFDDDSYDVIQANYAVGMVLHKSGLIDDAVEYFSMAATHMYDCDEMSSECGILAKYLYKDAKESKNYDLAKETAVNALKHTSEDQLEIKIRWLADLGAVCMQMNNYEEMETAYKEAIRLSRDSKLIELELEMMCYFSKAEWSAGLVRETINTQTAVIEEANKHGHEDSPWVAFALFNRALVNQSIGKDIPGVIADIERAIEIRSSIAGGSDATLAEYKDMLERVKGNDYSEDSSDTCSPEIREDIDYINSILTDNELSEEFRIALEGFDRGAIDVAVNRLNHLLTVIPEDIYSAKAMVLRYLAYSWELQAKHFPAKAKSHESIVHTYEQAVSLAEEDENYRLARKIIHDLSEYAWSQENYEIAENCYWKILLCNYYLDSFWSQVSARCLLRIERALTSRHDYHNWELGVSILALCYWVLYNGEFSNDQFGSTIDEKFSEYKSKIENEGRSLDVTVGAITMCIAEYLLSKDITELCDLASILLSWSLNYWSDNEQPNNYDKALDLMIKSKCVLGDCVSALHYINVLLNRKDIPESKEYRENACRALIHCDLVLLNVKASIEHAKAMPVDSKWFQEQFVTMMPCYGSYFFGDQRKAEESYKEYESISDLDEISLCDLFYYEIALGNNKEAASYLKRIMAFVSELEGEELDAYKSAIEDMNNILKEAA